MLRYIIATTNTALLPVLVIGTFLALYTLRMGPHAGKPLRAGVWLGVLSAVALVILKKNTGFVVREYYNLAVLIPTLLVEVVLIIFIWLPKSNPLARTPRKIFSVVAFLCLALWVAYSLPDILFYPFDFSVGMDTIFNTRYAYKVIGYSLGIIFAALALYATASIFQQISPRAIRWLFLACLAVFAGRQILAILQIGLGRNLIPRSPALVSVTIDMINRTQWFMLAVVGLCAVTAVIVYFKNRGANIAAPNKAILRKFKAAARRQRRWCGVLATIFVIAILSVTVGAAYENQEVVLDPPREIAVNGDNILIPVEMVDDGKLHRFKHNAPDGTEIRYIVIKKNETAFGVGLDACDICGASGYYERNDQVICILCDVVMNKSTIGFPGGCNPVPLAYRVEGGHMRITIADLEKDAWRFKE